jgi:tryptophan-rich sensory protein
VSRALVFALAVCVVSVALEGLFAGSGIKQRLAELKVPPRVPPLWGWIIIGTSYYVICFVLLYRLFAKSETVPLRQWALASLLVMMLVNALWNYFFFRTRNLLHAYLIGLPYSLIALLLLGLLVNIDRPAALCLLPYVLYLFYANLFGYRVWQLNSRPPP